MGWLDVSKQSLVSASTLVVVAGLVACDGEANSGERAAAATPASVLASAPKHRARRGEIVGGEKLARPVRWPRQALDLDLRARLSPATLASLPLAPAPVMVPRTGDWAQRGVLHNGESWSVFEAHDGDLHVNISASTSARRIPGVRRVELPDTVRGRPAIITRNEGVWSASWIENGVSYAAEMECGEGAHACEDELALLALTESLEIVGGAGYAENVDEVGARAEVPQ